MYAGTLAQAFQSYPEIVAPGSPSPEPVATTVTSVSQSVTVATGQTFNGAANLVDLHNAETDALTSGLETTTSTTDTYEGAISGTTAQLLGYGSNYLDGSGDSATTLPSPATILDELPETAGAAWSNGPGATIDEAIAGNATGSPITVVRTVNGDGTYTEKTTYPPNYSGTGVTGVGSLQENADGSGTFAIVADGGIVTITYSPPEPQASGPPLITIDEYDKLDTTGTPSASFQLASWYGTTPALYAETDRDEGVVAVPAACGLAAGLPAAATALQQAIARTDTILGYTEATTTTNYVAPGYGLICTALADKQTLYYDFNGDEPTVFTADPPLEIVTASETLGLQPSSIIAAASIVRGSHYTQPEILGAALRARFDRAVRAARANRLMAYVRRLESRRRQGGQR